jgi:hypothetical protein
MLKKSKALKLTPSNKAIKSLAEGILCYYIYLTKCGVSKSVSEYSLYEPFFRMLNKNKGMMVSCEYPVPIENAKRGDKRRIDFVIQQVPDIKSTKEKKRTQEDPVILYAIEMKFLKKAGKHFGKDAFRNDREKLLKLQEKQIAKFGKFIFVLYKTNKSTEALADSQVDLNSIIKCVDATYRLDVIKV